MDDYLLKSKAAGLSSDPPNLTKRGAEQVKRPRDAAVRQVCVSGNVVLKCNRILDRPLSPSDFVSGHVNTDFDKPAFRWRLDIFLIHNWVVFMRYSGPVGAARLAVIQCTIHMHLSVRPWCIHFSLFSGTSLPRRLGDLQDVMSQARVNNKAEAAEWVDSSHLWRDSCRVCCASLMSFILCLSPSWQWLMSLSCRVPPRWHSHLSFLSSLRCLTRWRIKVRERSQKNYWCHMFSEGNGWKKPWYWSAERERSRYSQTYK